MLKLVQVLNVFSFWQQRWQSAVLELPVHEIWSTVYQYPKHVSHQVAPVVLMLYNLCLPKLNNNGGLCKHAVMPQHVLCKSYNDGDLCKHTALRHHECNMCEERYRLVSQAGTQCSAPSTRV